MANYKTTTGASEPLGAVCGSGGVNFALFSEGAERVELLLFEPGKTEKPSAVIDMDAKTGNVRHCFVKGAAHGFLYLYRVYGRYEPEKGLRYNPSKALIDPYAKALTGRFKWDDSLLGYRADDYYKDLSYNGKDSLPFVPRCVIADTSYDWEGDAKPDIPLDKTVIYETHVKGLTKLHPQVDKAKRGAYAGLASDCVIEHLKSLGVTAVELLPVHHSMDEIALYRRNLTNYWGYNTIGYFAPDSRFSSTGDTGGQISEFKDMVKTLHRAGIEVILDVVYNHTAESDRLGPTVSFRGIDNLSYYYTDLQNPQEYLNFTGCGNSLRIPHPQARSLVLDSLRYWVEEMHVDGFRFDLAPTLARDEEGNIDPDFSFFKAVAEDPVISKVKLITESWDIGENGHQTGKFPIGYCEWNDSYRDTLRRYWNGHDAGISEVSARLAGSADMFQHNRETPLSSVNYITAHDGFTLNDLVSYNNKHNAFNKEGNRDGADENYSWNCGVEGSTDKPEVTALRERQKRNMLASIVLSQGIPMLLGGDEIGRTQSGNNNAYCQDNRVNWYDWNLDADRRRLFDFTRRVTSLRASHPVFRRRAYFTGEKTRGSAIKDVVWVKPDGSEIAHSEWGSGAVRSFGMFLNGEAVDERAKEGRGESRDSFLLLMNPGSGGVDFTMPDFAEKWESVLYTLDDDAPASTHSKGETFSLIGHSLALFRKM